MQFKTLVFVLIFFSPLVSIFVLSVIFSSSCCTPCFSLIRPYAKVTGDYTALTYSLSSIQSCQLAACPSSARPGREIAAIRQRGVLAELNFSTQASAEENKPRAAFFFPSLQSQLKECCELIQLQFCQWCLKLTAHTRLLFMGEKFYKDLFDCCLGKKVGMGKKCFRPPLIYFYYLLTLNQSLLHNSRL